VALTLAAWERCVRVPPGPILAGDAGRLFDVPWVLRLAVARHAGRRVVPFAPHVRNDNRGRLPPPVRLKAVSGPGDLDEPVITVMVPEEDCPANRERRTAPVKKAFAAPAVWDDPWHPPGWHEVIPALSFRCALHVARTARQLGAEGAGVHGTARGREPAAGEMATLPARTPDHPGETTRAVQDRRPPERQAARHPRPPERTGRPLGVALPPCRPRPRRPEGPATPRHLPATAARPRPPETATPGPAPRLPPGRGKPRRRPFGVGNHLGRHCRPSPRPSRSKPSNTAAT
jgi:hypothetical protein